MKQQLQEILVKLYHSYNGADGHALPVDEAYQAILDLLDKSLPGSKPFGKGYNQALADVRKVIEEKTND